MPLATSQKTLIASGAIVLLLSIVSIIKLSIYNNAHQTGYDLYYKVYNIRIPKTLFFANERIPLENQKVRDYLAFTIIKNTKWKEQSILLHKRASCWFGVIEPILKRNHIPDDFKYIALVESRLANVVSPKGATGFWQILEGTGKQYGLEINEDIDERYSVRRSTETACKYFKEAYKQLHDWTLVAASYNKGIGGVQKQLKNQKKNNYYDLKLNKETGSYVYKIIAMKELICNPKIYGLKIKEKDLRTPYITKKLIVDSSIHNLASFSKKQGIDLKTLKVFNPWLKTNQLPNPENRRYIIEIPKNKSYSRAMEIESGVLYISLKEMSMVMDSTAPL
jgi:membrane-bound lytic murein transglycosylase D